MTKERIKAVVSFALAEFSPLIGFLVLSWTFGLKVAIAGTVAIVVVDTSWRLWKRVPFTRTYILFVTLTVGFGVIDLLSAEPFMLKYEAVITNTVTAGFFVLGAAGPKPLIQEVAEQRGLFRPQGGVLFLDGLDAADGRDAIAELHAGASHVFSVPALGAVAGGATGRSGRWI